MDFLWPELVGKLSNIYYEWEFSAFWFKILPFCCTIWLLSLVKIGQKNKVSGGQIVNHCLFWTRLESLNPRKLKELHLQNTKYLFFKRLLENHWKNCIFGDKFDGLTPSLGGQFSFSPSMLSFDCFSARRAAWGGGQAIQLQHSGGPLEAALWWQAEWGHQGLSDLHPAQKLGNCQDNNEQLSHRTVKFCLQSYSIILIPLFTTWMSQRCCFLVAISCGLCPEYSRGSIIQLMSRCVRREFTNTTASLCGSTLAILKWPHIMSPDSSRTPNTKYRYLHGF